MRKKLLPVICLLACLSFCGCSNAKSNNTSGGSSAGQDSNVIYINDVSQASMGNKTVQKPKDQPVSAPDGSITFEEACQRLDTCGKKDFYLPESMSAYRKYYFGTVDYQGELYYSIYPYYESNGKRLYAGTNCLVSLNGEVVRAQNWMGGYDLIDQNTAADDKDIKAMYPDAKITPNEALSVLAQKEKALGLERSIEDYVFETDERLIEVSGIPCYCFTPKLEYTDHIDLLKVYYVTSDGTNTILSAVTGSPTEFVELKV